MKNITRKQKRAIALYVALNLESKNYYEIINKVLKADRMPKEALFKFLDQHGYIWDAILQGWRKKGKRIKDPNPWVTNELSYFD